jgi:dihydroflavonol-4-reductase
VSDEHRNPSVEVEPTSIGRGDRVLVTGASGFIGSAVTRALSARGAQVVALLQPGASDTNLAGLDVEHVVADVRDRKALGAAALGARFVFHLAALYRFWPHDPRRFYEVNVEGTRTVLAAARAAGCERVVYTSSVATLGKREGLPADETTYAHTEDLVGSYEQSKYVAEHEALREAASGLPLVVVQPTTPFGPGDETPTPSGRIVLDFLNGRMVAWVDTALNVVDVADVATGHILAAERGANGRSYILGGENLDLREILQRLADCTGLPAPRFQVPRGLLVPISYVSDTLEGRLLGRSPTVPIDGVRIAATRRVFSDARARRELGYESRSAAEALERAARWFVDHDYVSQARLEKITWRSSAGGRETGPGRQRCEPDGQ